MKKKKIIIEYTENSTFHIEQIVNEYTGYLYKVIQNAGNNELSNEDIEEIMTEVFWIVWKNREKLDARKPISSYLAGVAHKLVQKKKSNVKNYINLEEECICNIEALKIDDILQERERTRYLYDAISQMKEQDQKIFIQFYYEGKKIKEIAQKMCINDFTVKTRLHRIRNELKKNLEKGGY